MTTVVQKPDGPYIMTPPDYDGLTLTRPEFIEVIGDVLNKIGVHMNEYEREKIHRFAREASKVSFGIWGTKAGCPLEQTGLCTSAYKVDSVFELFIDHFDKAMIKRLELPARSRGTAVIL